MDILCVSQASTSIISSMDEAASSSSCSSSSAAIQLGGRAIDRHNPIIRDTKRFNTNPLPSNQLIRKKEKDSSSSSTSTSTSSKSKNNDRKKMFSSVLAKSNDQNKKSSTKNGSLKPEPDVEEAETGSGKIKAVDLVTPPGSTRYLLGDPGFFYGEPDYDPVWPMVHAEENKIRAVKQDGVSDYDLVWPMVHAEENNIQAEKQDGISDYDLVWPMVPTEENNIQTKNQDQTIISKPHSDQVVVLRVSLHCKGCAGKVKKHLSRMEGVRSFNVDFAAKKVTVVGDVTPLSVLASVSKVKSAQFWTSETPAMKK